MCADGKAGTNRVERERIEVGMWGRVVEASGGMESEMRDKELLLAPVAEFTRRRRVPQDGHHREMGDGIAPQFEVKREERAKREGSGRRNQRRSEAPQCDGGGSTIGRGGR